MGAPMPGPQGQPQPPLRREAPAKAELGQLAENIPRAMRVGKSERVEVRIAKAQAKSITSGLEGGGLAWRHDVTVTQAMSVRLRAPDGGFFIETASPETQWIENQLGLMAVEEYASWRFLVTPNKRGRARLQIIVSARTVGGDGLAAETALPDQVIEVKVRTNWGRALLRWSGWIIAAVAGGALAKFGEGAFGAIMPLVNEIMKRTVE
jgi:neural Wiskott-Aldrich syndrome protein